MKDYQKHLEKLRTGILPVVLLALVLFWR